MVYQEKVLLPTAYFPPISYFVFLMKSWQVSTEIMETYPRQTIRNRCEIMTAAGRTRLVVPVTKPFGNHTMTRDIEISDREPWQQKQWKTIQSAYGSSPFFDYYADILHKHFENKEPLLFRHNNNIMLTINQLIGIQATIEFTEDYEKKNMKMFDLRSDKRIIGNQSLYDYPKYPQVFEHKFGFMPGLSILDLLFNKGPESKQFLSSIVVGR
jgi:hypothetical protein